MVSRDMGADTFTTLTHSPACRLSNGSCLNPNVGGETKSQSSPAMPGLTFQYQTGLGGRLAVFDRPSGHVALIRGNRGLTPLDPSLRGGDRRCRDSRKPATR